MKAPYFVSAELSSGVAVAGASIACVVEWVGEPRATPEFQWFNGRVRLRGATLSTFTPAVAMPDLVCRVSVDNGRGCATAYARLEPVPPTDPDPISLVFVAGVYIPGVYV